MAEKYPRIMTIERRTCRSVLCSSSIDQEGCRSVICYEQQKNFSYDTGSAVRISRESDCTTDKIRAIYHMINEFQYELWFCGSFNK